MHTLLDNVTNTQTQTAYIRNMPDAHKYVRKIVWQKCRKSVAKVLPKCRKKCHKSVVEVSQQYRFIFSQVILQNSRMYRKNIAKVSAQFFSVLANLLKEIKKIDISKTFDDQLP